MADERRVALVTGAASGIGKATAEAFLARGYATVLVDFNEEAGRAAEEELKEQGDCLFIPCDVADEAAVESTFARAVEAYGRLDAAFNGAGIDGEMGPTADGTVENFDRIMAVNLRGLWLCMRQEIAQMLKQGGGAIVNCASTQGLFGVPMLSAYVASKHGVVGLTRTAALEYIPHNIRINAVCPGKVNTPMWQRSIPPEMTAKLLEDDPFGRLGEPTEIAEAVVWLCDPTSSFVVGHPLVVDGGMTVQ